MRNVTYNDTLQAKEKRGFIIKASVLLVITAICIVLTTVVFAATKQQMGSKVRVALDIFEYTQNSDLSYTIKGLKNPNMSNVIIPATHNGQKVSGIADNAFDGNTNITSLTIGENITNIGQYAFRNTSNLSQVFFNATNCNSLMSKDVFYDSGISTSGITATIGSNVTVIPDYLFGHSSSHPANIKNVVFKGNSLTKIGIAAFLGCTNLTSISLPTSGLTNIDNAAFRSTGLTGKLTIPSTIKRLGNQAFGYCSKITDVTIPSSVTEWNPLGFQNCTSLQHVTIQNGVTSIGNSMFSGCTNLVDVTVPSSIKSIGMNTFMNCSNLDDITIPSSVNSIGIGAFSGCTNLANITIEDGVESLGNNVFQNCTSLTNLTIPDSVQTIGTDVLSGCSGLTTLTVPFVGETSNPTSTADTSKTVFGYFFGTTSYDGGTAVAQPLGTDSPKYYIPTTLTTVTVNGGVIGSYAFDNYSHLKSITIGENVSSIGNYVFRNALNLQTVNFNATSCYDSSIFSSRFDNTGRDGGGITLTIGEKVQYIPWYMFGCSFVSYAPNITSVVFKSNGVVNRIGRYAFQNCKNLSTITIPSTVTRIEDDAFVSCSGLKSLTIPTGVTEIGKSAFAGCSSLATLSLPFVGNTKTGTTNTFFGYIFGASAYSSQNSNIPSTLKTVTITNCTSIPENAFYGCSYITSITIPTGVTTMGKSALQGCSSLATLSLPFVGNTKTANTFFGYIFGASDYSNQNSSIPSALKTVRLTNCTSIPANAFYGCSNITSITMPTTVTTIGQTAFYNCSKITSLTIPTNVTIVGIRALAGCSSLTSLTLPFVGGTKTGSTTNTYFGYIFGASSYSNQNSSIPSGLTTVTLTNCTSIPDYAFYGCTGITTIDIPSTVSTIGSYSFGNCRYLANVYIRSGTIYAAATSTTACGYLLQYATKVYVVKSCMTGRTNSYLNSSNFSISSSGTNYTVFTKV